jgi:uncharacterized Fe-S center protein
VIFIVILKSYNKEVKMSSKVFFSGIENHKMQSPLNKIKKLINKCGPEKIFLKDELVAIKIHFGELGNTAFIRPIYLRPIIEILKKLKTKPFLTDTNTLYVGMRTNSVDHFHNAMFNGFGYSTLQTPIIIADGLRGENIIDVEINLPLQKYVSLASDIVNADAMICVSHFKGHEISGFGGAIKNLSMGCASRKGKMEMHSESKPTVNQENCTSCGRCAEHCASNAIKMQPKAYITDNCTGCSRCIAVCPEKTIKINWDASSSDTMKRMIEYAYGVYNSLNKKIIFVNFITSVSPDCDCFPGNDKPVVEDIGFAASLDPIALDKACLDLVIKHNDKENPFEKIYPEINSYIQFEHSKKIGFGSTEYNLIKIKA